MNRIYLDHINTTPAWPEVITAMKVTLDEEWGLPSALHQGGLRARDLMNESRQKVAQWVGARHESEVVFTSCGTESVNLAIKGAAFRKRRPGNHIIVSTIEHPAVLRSVEFLETLGYEVSRVRVDQLGFIDAEEWERAVRPDTCLAALHLVNHDLGTIQPVGELIELVKRKNAGALCFVDATAGAGWVEMKAVEWNVDLLAMSPHRFYGPKGVGLLYRSRRARLESWMHGGDQENGLRAGSENLAAIVGAGVAAENVEARLSSKMELIRAKTRNVLESLKSRIPYLKLHGAPVGETRAPHHLNFSVEFIEGEGQALMLDALGVGVSSGSACVSRSLKPSYTLAALGVSKELALSNIILGIGIETEDEELKRFLDLFCDKVVPRLRDMSLAWEDFQNGRLQSQTIRL